MVSQFTNFFGTGSSSVLTLTGDLGTPATPDVVGNIDIIGGTNINTSSDAAGHQVTVNLDGTITLTRVNATTFDTNVAAAGLEITATTISADGTDANIDINITPKGTGLLNTTYILASGTIGADELYTTTPERGLTLTENIIQAVGTDTDINITLTPKGTGVIAGTELTLTTALAVGYGGTGLTAPTDHCVLVGSGAAAITPITAGTNGQVLIGSTNNDPVFASVTEGTNIDVTGGAGALEIETTKVEINAQTGTTYQFVAGDAGKLVTLTNAGAITLTVPPNATVAFPIGTVITIYQGGAGTVTVTPGGGVTVNSVGGATDLSAQYAMAALHKIDTDSWVLAGSLS